MIYLSWQKACFKATDNSDNSSYADSGAGTDISPPSITVSSVSASNQVSASVVDAVDGNPDFSYQLITTATVCDSNLSTNFSNYTADDLLELAVGQKACFKATDNSDNSSYADSGAGTDISPPSITVSSVSASNQVSASVVDAVDGNPDFSYQLITTATVCDSNLSTNFSNYTADDLLELAVGQKACFKATDNSDNSSYADSGAGTDISPPSITVSSVSASNQVSASVVDAVDSNPDFSYQLITTATVCDSNLSTNFSNYTADDLLELAVGQKACFKATDNSDNSSYADSGAGTDISPPSITVSSVSASNQVSASVVDAVDSNPDFSYQLITTATVCDSNLSTNFSNYTADDLLELAVGQKACFKATDNSDNSSYADSGAGTDISPPSITVSSVSASNQVSASVVDAVDGNPDFSYQLITTATVCDSNLSTNFSNYTADDLLELAVGQKACFKATDNSDNSSYADSGAGTDISPPSITVSSVSASNQVSASVVDAVDSNPDFSYQLITTATVCDSNLSTNFSNYTADDLLELAVGQKACFKATDSTTPTASTVATPTPGPALTSVHRQLRSLVFRPLTKFQPQSQITSTTHQTLVTN